MSIPKVAPCVRIKRESEYAHHPKKEPTEDLADRRRLAAAAPDPLNGGLKNSAEKWITSKNGSERTHTHARGEVTFRADTDNLDVTFGIEP